MYAKKIRTYLSIIAGIAAGLFLFPFTLKVFAPFVVAFCVATPCQKIVRGLQNKFHLNRGISSALISTSIVAIVIFAIVFILFQLYSQSKNLISALPAAIDSFRGQLSRLTEQFDGYKHTLPSELSTFFDNASLSIKDYFQSLSHKATATAFSIATGFASRLPSLLLFATMFILSTFFFTKDYSLIINFFKEILPKKVISSLSKGAAFISRAFSSYLKAQLILMLLTMALVTICLWIVGKESPLLWGLVCGLVDVLPFLGTAIILVPWALFALVYGDTYSFIALLVIQIIVFLVRQLAEPKIVSRQIGIHPILTLIGVYVGLRYFGIIGVIVAPIIMLLVVNIYVTYKEKGAI